MPEFAAPVLEWVAWQTADSARTWHESRTAFSVRFEEGGALGLVEDQEEFPPCVAAALESEESMEDLLEELESKGWPEEWAPEPEEAWVAFAETLPARLQRLLDGCARLLGDGDDGAIDGDTSFIFADIFGIELKERVYLRFGSAATRPNAAWTLLGALVRHGSDAG